MPDPPAGVDEYIAGFPEEVQTMLTGVRRAIRAALPEGEERIRYGMPAVMIGERGAIHFAGWKKHVGLYPIAQLSPALEAEIAPYRSTKDTVRFFYTQPIPYDLIERAVAEVRDFKR